MFLRSVQLPRVSCVVAFTEDCYVVYPRIARGAFLTVVTSAAVNIHMHVWCGHVSVSLGRVEMQLSGHTVAVLNPWRK